MTHRHWLWIAVSLAALGSGACRESADGSPEPAPSAAPMQAAVTPSSPAPAAAPAPPASAPPRPSVRLMPRTIARLNPGALATGDPVAAPTPGGTAGATAPAGTPPTPPESPPPPAIVIRGLDVHPIDATEGEDGRGQRVPAVRPVALDVRADAWPGRALDPVLLVGDLEFRHYAHPGPGVLRYVAADADTLPDGAPVRLRWGEDEDGSLAVTPALQVPR